MVIIKEPLRIRRERRSKIKIAPEFTIEKKTEIENAKPVIEKEKVELKDIDQQLEELLG